MIDKNLFKYFLECAKEKNVSIDHIVEAFKKSLLEVLKVKCGEFFNPVHFDIIIDEEEKNIQILHYKNVVKNKEKDDKNINTISLTDAKKIEKGISVGEMIVEDLSFDIFSRNEVNKIKQDIINNISIEQQQNIKEKYQKLINEIVTVKVYSFCRGYILVQDATQNELFLPYSEQIPGERLKKGTFIKALVKKIEVQNNKINVILSRVGIIFLKKLLEFDIPEIADGLVIVKKIARIAGERSKVVVESVDPHIDPIGACVGTKCTRLHALNSEMGGELVDFIQFSSNINVFIAKALGIDKIEGVKNMKNGLFVYVDEEKIPIAIGKNGINVRLLKILLDQNVSISKYVKKIGNIISIDDFFDNLLDYWIIATMKECGFETVQEIANTPKDVFEKKTDFEKETVDRIYEIVKEKYKE